MIVDGARAHIGQKVDPARAEILVDRVPLPVAPDLVHYVLYKPVDVISTSDDPQGRPTVVSLVPGAPRVFPVGRLDADSEGLLILTNDGVLTERLTHPRYGVTKTYVVLVDGAPSAAALRRLTDGIDLDDGPARARSARLIDTSPSQALVEIVMSEGRKREVRRMFDAVGHPVRRLVRTAIGSLRDPDLAPGSWRRLDVFEVRRLYDEGGATWEDGGPTDDASPSQ